MVESTNGKKKSAESESESYFDELDGGNSREIKLGDGFS